MIGPWTVEADDDLDVWSAGDLDRLCPDVVRQRHAVVEIVRGILRIGRFDEEILRIRADVRRAPGDVGIVSEDDRRGPRES